VTAQLSHVHYPVGVDIKAWSHRVTSTVRSRPIRTCCQSVRRRSNIASPILVVCGRAHDTTLRRWTYTDGYYWHTAATQSCRELLMLLGWSPNLRPSAGVPPVW